MNNKNVDNKNYYFGLLSATVVIGTLRIMTTVTIYRFSFELPLSLGCITLTIPCSSYPENSTLSSEQWAFILRVYSNTLLSSFVSNINMRFLVLWII